VTRDELELLTLAEVAELFHLGERTVEKLVANGTIPSVKIGRARRVRAVDAARIASSGTDGYVDRTSTERSSR
jgi:excisionase family DNA binding protein